MKKIKAQTTFLQNIPELLRKMAKSSRYRKCRVSGFVNEILPSETKQFAAVTVELPDGTVYISFRGTDDTIIGWKEDFNLSNGIVPSHKRALEYLEKRRQIYPVHAADRRPLQRWKPGYVCSHAVWGRSAG